MNPMTKMKTIATTLLGTGLLALASPAEAGTRTYVAAECAVFMMMDGGTWKQINNGCFMARDHETNMTFVKMGKAVLVIKRDPKTYGLARIYTIDSAGNTSEGETAVARGPCWSGITLKFCAP